MHQQRSLLFGLRYLSHGIICTIVCKIIDDGCTFVITHFRFTININFKISNGTYYMFLLYIGAK